MAGVAALLFFLVAAVVGGFLLLRSNTEKAAPLPTPPEPISASTDQPRVLPPPTPKVRPESTTGHLPSKDTGPQVPVPTPPPRPVEPIKPADPIPPVGPIKPVAPPQPAPRKPTLENLKVTLPEGWSARYNKFLPRWYFEKATSTAKSPHETNQCSVGEGLDDPTSLAAYADKLKQRDAIDLDTIFTQITAREPLADGFLLKGTVKKDFKDRKPKLCLGLVMMRDLDGVKLFCKSTCLYSEALRDEAIALFQSAKLDSGP